MNNQTANEELALRATKRITARLMPFLIYLFIVAFINSVGNLGGFVGPYIIGYLNNRTGSFYSGIIYLSASALTAALLISLVQPMAVTRDIQSA